MNEKVRRILLLDTGHEWGGGTNSMIELLKRIDRNRFVVTACFYRNYRQGDSTLQAALAAIDIPLLILPTRTQPLWAKLAKELARGILFWHKSWRAAVVFGIELAWRIRPRAKALAKLLAEGAYDLLYMNNHPASNLEGYLAAEMSGVPVVQHCRIEPKLNTTECAAVNRLAHAVICVSQGVREALVRQGVRAELCQVVYNAIDSRQNLPVAQPLIDVRQGTPVVGTISSLVKRKSVDHLMRAMAKLPTESAPHLLIVGEGPEETSLLHLSEELGLVGRITFAGFQKQPLPWLATMDVFALTSPSEGLPRVILEAMLLAKPVVASNVNGSKEVVVHGETGYLYPYGDIDALAAYLADLLHDPSKRQAFGNAGRRRVSAKFSIETYVAGVTRILESA
ncbi:MAG: glycosyltransferase [Rhodocyclaceae bacterium]|nr:glycosyltransferase [Rhodocyclaceae bacterium]